MAIKTQGTELFAIDPEDGSLITVGCITQIDGLDTTRSQIEVECLGTDDSEFLSGKSVPGTATFAINTDHREASHLRLHELHSVGTTLKWALGWRQDDANGIATMPGTPPTVDSTGGEEDFDLPGVRSWIVFDGYISSFPFTFSGNSVVGSSVGIQISGKPVWVPAE